MIRPVILFAVNPTERAEATSISRRTIYYKANLFDSAGMASLLPPELPPSIPKLDKRTLPPPMRQAIVDVQAEYPEHLIHEIATICYVQFGRRPGPQTIKLYLLMVPSHHERRNLVKGCLTLVGSIVWKKKGCGDTLLILSI